MMYAFVRNLWLRASVEASLQIRYRFGVRGRKAARRKRIYRVTQRSLEHTGMAICFEHLYKAKIIQKSLSGNFIGSLKWASALSLTATNRAN